MVSQVNLVYANSPQVDRCQNEKKLCCFSLAGKLRDARGRKLLKIAK